MSLNAVLYQSAALLYISGDRCESPLPFMESSPIFLVFQSNAKHTCSEQLYVTRKNVFFLNLVKASMESTFAQGRRSWDVESAWTARRAVRSKSSCALCNMRANVNLAGKFSGMFRIPVVDWHFGKGRQFVESVGIRPNCICPGPDYRLRCFSQWTFTPKWSGPGFSRQKPSWEHRCVNHCITCASAGKNARKQT